MATIKLKSWAERVRPEDAQADEAAETPSGSEAPSQVSDADQPDAANADAAAMNDDEANDDEANDDERERSAGEAD